MTKFGLTLSSEEHAPRRLLEIAELAEQTGFDFVSISDHIHPWIDEQGHSPNVWPMLGALSERTGDIGVVVGVTCPTVRIHPVINAHLVATAALLLGDRFTWGVGTGEALNEHVLADRWPPAPERIEMLEEAIVLMRELWKGESVTFDGRYYSAENARIYDIPEHPIEVVMSAFGPIAAAMAARVADGLWVTGSESSSIDVFRENGGKGPVYSQLTCCWGEDESEALDLAHRVWPTSVVPGQLSQDLPTPQHFEQAIEIVTKEMVAEEVPCGPDLTKVAEQAEEAIANGVDHLYFHQIGPDQEGFCKAWTDQVAPRLRKG
jgi:coenzyme F420-dependent glucose-6-phosphate dehydrogenase